METVPESVAAAGDVIEKITPPVRIWHEVAPLHPAPMVCTDALVSVALKSLSCAATCAPPPPPPPVSWLQVFVAVHPNKFWPAGEVVSKKSSPCEQRAGTTVPIFAGFVETALLKSTSLVWVAISTCVWAQAKGTDVSKNTIEVPIRPECFMEFILELTLRALVPANRPLSMAMSLEHRYFRPKNAA